MKNLLALPVVCLLLCIGGTAHAQTDHKWEIGVYGGPSVMDLFNPKLDETLGPHAGGTAGVQFRYQVKPRLWLGSGLQYQCQGFKLRNDEYSGEDINGNVIIYGHTDYRELYHSLGIPLSVWYHFWEKGKISLYGRFSLVPQFMVYQYRYFIVHWTDSKPDLDESGPNPYPIDVFQLNGQLGLGVRFQVTPKISLTAEPVFGASIKSIAKDSNTYPIFLDGILQLGVQYAVR